MKIDSFIYYTIFIIKRYLNFHTDYLFLARIACRDVSEEQCKGVKPHCFLENVSTLCPYTCNTGGCECKDHPGYETKCKGATPDLCQRWPDIMRLCPRTCGNCPGA